MGFISGCTALGIQDEDSGDLFLGRNFDFYVGDKFAKNKILAAIRPEDGYAFLSLTWAGMMGVVSGMNEEGLAIALNAGPSEMPGNAKTPVTILAREMLQYAATIDEAISIAEQRDVFVSENIIVASGSENRIVAIEKSPGRTAIYETSPDSFICTNHFQSRRNENSGENLAAIKKTSTSYRLERVKELRHTLRGNALTTMSCIMRNRLGHGNRLIGNGNEMALNQLSGHHSIIFNLSARQMYIAGVPNQLGPYFRYDIDSIFSIQCEAPARLWLDTIPADSFLLSGEYARYLQYKTEQQALETSLKNGQDWNLERLAAFVALNPDHYESHLLVGAYLIKTNQCAEGLPFLKKALNMPIAWDVDRERIESLITSCH